MKKFNLDFIGTIVSSPKGVCSWSGTTYSFWGKFKEDPNYKYGKYNFTREFLIEAIPIKEERPSGDYYRCSGILTVPEKYLYVN